MGGLVGTPGPPVVIFMRRFFREAFFRAQLIAVFACASVTLCAMLWLKGVGDAESARRTGALLLPLLDRLEARLERVERRLYEVTRSDDDFLTEIAQHLLGAGRRVQVGEAGQDGLVHIPSTSRVGADDVDCAEGTCCAPGPDGEVDPLSIFVAIGRKGQRRA